MERAADPNIKFDVVTFDLATGAKVRAALDEFWEQLSDDDLRHGQQPRLYFAIRVYSDEGTNPRRLVSHTEFRAGNDFDQSCIPRLWTWLDDLSLSKHRFSYDCVEDFLEEFCARMDEFAIAGEDAADYLYRTHGLNPHFEDPPHTEFPEDEFSSRARTDGQPSNMFSGESPAGVEENIDHLEADTEDLPSDVSDEL